MYQFEINAHQKNIKAEKLCNSSINEFSNMSTGHLTQIVYGVHFKTSFFRGRGFHFVHYLSSEIQSHKTNACDFKFIFMELHLCAYHLLSPDSKSKN